jgi:hypothetical protein
MPHRPDFSDYLAHFTKEGAPVAAEENANPASQFTGKGPLDRLASILEDKKILATELPFRLGTAVCFTECPWVSLLAHARRYSPYAVGFHKARVFAAGGGPVYYVRADHWKKQQWTSHVKTFATPFWPEYRARTLRGAEFLGGKTVDFSHEREWRVPHDFKFELAQVEFVIVDSADDLGRIPDVTRAAIGDAKFLVMDVYRNIERIWPVHRVET